MRKIHIATTLILVAAALAVSKHWAGVARKTAIQNLGISGKIAFSRDEEGETSIYVINADGSNETQLTRGAYQLLGQDSSPSFSPDGKKITFTSNRGSVSGYTEIYIMNADGSHQVDLTPNSKANDFPSFSPDGKTIIFNCEGEGIFRINIDGSHLIRLSNDTQAISACFSPDGKKIVFKSKGGICTMNADGTHIIRLTHSKGFYSFPAFSPDGKKIIFSFKRDQSNLMSFGEIYVMNTDGSGQKRLTNTTTSNALPCFSPDGKNILFTAFINNQCPLQIMNADGSHQTPFAGGLNGVGPSWVKGSVPAPQSLT